MNSTAQVAITIAIQAPTGPIIFQWPTQANAVPPVNANSPVVFDQRYLIGGVAASISPPSGTQYVVLWSANPSSAGNVGLSGVGTDSGFIVNPAMPVLLPMPASIGSTLVLVSTTTQTIMLAYV
jgi:hypothetical protein